MDSQQKKDRPKKIVVKNLSIDFDCEQGKIHAVKNVSFEILKGSITALVGESGSGKSVTSMSLMGLLDSNGKVTGGNVFWEKNDLLKMKPKKRMALNGNLFGMIFQDPMTSLDPLFSIETQMVEGIRYHSRCSKKEAYEKAVKNLFDMGFDEPEKLMKKRPFELSGGMCQRVMIAMMIALEPQFLIADEPTTALDVTVQKQILKKIYRICHEKNVGVLFITHDLGVVGEIADKVYIMQKGEIVDKGNAFDIFDRPNHSYTKKLIASIIN
ncbi:peptide/nickel transport system ATP-binding protein/oligopeptide transport system ATP-binding protein [Acetitomaculum ruminis DSM 5522]|uniref:Peptide/nickel transport system ATP-binding protein/oligopeptide transport system ATP-binding protein n=1 Tax=Acetitomaculum ruminis DSM 5522 TaxID=1120918 RepID=A0A1I0WMX9_9FIRM|nr:ABC transporter ATP-binding protein [Acetitomaculum ruminis]SFA89981.1 peptide/nickel transport system ATP-binding protein/oligopeptide transport system ATP-binding protein [Acetitomaculum ruminis DSM 5522]